MDQENLGHTYVASGERVGLSKANAFVRNLSVKEESTVTTSVGW